MRLPAWGLLLFLLATAVRASAQEELLSRMMETMRHALARMPDYTCTETITRSIGDGTPLRVKTVERLRLQVAIIGGKELFSWPGAGPFEREDPHAIVGSGLAGTGDFAGFSRAVFGDRTAIVTEGEEELRGGVPTVRYGYRIPREASGYTLRGGGHSAIVDYGGRFWVDRATERVLALEVEADSRRNRVPAELDMFDVKTLLEYRQLGVAGEELPFPAGSTLTVMHLRSSIVTSNHIDFAGCRQYTADSSIHFGEETSAAPGVAFPPLPDQLAGGLEFDVALSEPIHAATSAAGDAITATLLRSVKSGRLQIPKGAKLLGRILHLETDVDSGATHVRIGFSHLEAGGRYFPFRARFSTFNPAPGVVGGAPRPRWINLREPHKGDAAEWTAKADFTLTGKDGQMAKGFRLEWVTL